MRTINSKSQTMAKAGLTPSQALEATDRLLRDHGLEIVTINTQDTVIIILEKIFDEEVVLETPPVTPMVTPMVANGSKEKPTYSFSDNNNGRGKQNLRNNDQNRTKSS